MKLAAFAASVLLVSSAALPAARADVAVPELRSRVTDLTGTLDRAAQESLEARLRAFEEKRGSQIAVLIVPTTEPETIEQYSIRVAEKWKLGRKGIDDGALLVVAMKDRTMRIEVGYGLEGALNDATCKRIISEIITPELQRGNIRGGIEAGVEQMMRVIEGEPLPTPVPRPRGRDGGGGGDGTSLLFFLAFVTMGAGNALRPFVGRLVAAVVVGIGAAVIAAFVMSVGVAVVIGLLCFVLALFGAAGGSWSSGRRGDGGGGFGGSGGGGFGGGGGGFGGGGASGRW